MNQEQELEDRSTTQTETKNYTTQLSDALEKTPREYQRIIYQFCKQYYPGLIKIAKVFIDHTKNDFDNHVSVEGGTGSGKSAWTFLVVHIIHEMLHNTFNLKKQCLFIPDEGELKHKMHNLKQHESFWLDEAIRALDKKRWWDADQIDMNHIVKTERWRNNTVFYNIQRFAELTETFRNDNIYFRIFIIKKFASVLYVKDEDKDIEDPWHVKNNLSIKYKNKYGATRYSPIMTPRERLLKERKCPNYFMDSEFPDPGAIPGIKEYWEYYKNLKMASREREKEKSQRKAEKKGMNKYEAKYKKELSRVMTQLLAEHKGTKKELVKKFGLELSEPAYYDLFNVKQNTKDNKTSINNSILEKELLVET